MNIKNIIFDWSGVLSDDITPVCCAIIKVFERLGLPPVTSEEIKKEFTIPVIDFYRKFDPALTNDEVQKLFIEEIKLAEDPKAFPKAKETLESLRQKNIKMIIISAHPHDKLIQEADEYGFKNYFQEINGSVQDKRIAISDIIQKNNFDLKQTLYVGDMTHDVDAGKVAGVVTVALSSGYQSKEKLLESNPDYLISDLSGLNQLVE